MRVNVSSLKYSSRAKQKKISRDKEIRCGVLNVKNFDEFLDLLSSRCMSEWIECGSGYAFGWETGITVKFSPYCKLIKHQKSAAY